MFSKSRWTLQVTGRQNFTCRLIIVKDMKAIVIFSSNSWQEGKKAFSPAATASEIQVNQNYFWLQQLHVSAGTNEPVITCQMFDNWAASLVLWDSSKHYMVSSASLSVLFYYYSCTFIRQCREIHGTTCNKRSPALKWNTEVAVISLSIYWVSAKTNFYGN